MQYLHEFNIQETLRGFNLIFKTTYDLFSYKVIDEGTRLLINTIKVNDGQKCLDLGCGYGPIGIVMAKLNKNGKIYMIDKDFIAVEFSKINCQLNNLSNCEVLLSNGFSHLQNKKFDIIASNLPTHIAKESLIKIVTDTKSRLNKNGKFYIVCTTRLQPFIKNLLEPIFNNLEKLAQNNGYSVLSVENI